MAPRSNIFGHLRTKSKQIQNRTRTKTEHKSEHIQKQKQNILEKAEQKLNKNRTHVNNKTQYTKLVVKTAAVAWHGKLFYT